MLGYKILFNCVTMGQNVLIAELFSMNIVFFEKWNIDVLLLEKAGNGGGGEQLNCCMLVSNGPRFSKTSCYLRKR
jgi:hypothetical protein